MDGLNHNDISMETLQTFIVNAIKSITSEKRANELTIYEFVKNGIRFNYKYGYKQYPDSIK